MSDFMQPQAYQDTWYEYEIHGETFFTDDESTIPEDAIRGEIYHDRYFARLSAPGYLDCTDWQGPYWTEDGALWDLYGFYGTDDQTFFSFLGEGRKIEYGSLEVRGLNNELYGRAVGEDLIHLGTLGPDFLEQDPETGELLIVDHDRGELIGIYDPNKDDDLPDAYDFEIVQDRPWLQNVTLDDSGRELSRARQRILNAKRDSEYYLPIRVFWLWSDHSWAETTVDYPAERPRWQQYLESKRKIRSQLEEKDAIMRRYGLNFGLPDLVLVDVIETGTPEEESEGPHDWIEYTDALDLLENAPTE